MGGEGPPGLVFRGRGKDGGAKDCEEHPVHRDWSPQGTPRRVPPGHPFLLPDLFKEGKGVVAQGKMGGGHFVATEVLAKHDENYMPPEAALTRRLAKTLKSKTAEGPESHDPRTRTLRLILALVLALVQGVLPLVGAARQRRLDGAGAPGRAGGNSCSLPSPSPAWPTLSSPTISR